MSMSTDLRNAALPFITRILRGARLRRTVAMSVVMGMLSVVLGAWVALGSGAIERELRQGFDLEPHRWERERFEYLIVADFDEELEQLEFERETIASRHDDSWSRVQVAVDDAAGTLRAVAAAGTPPERHAKLAERAAQVLAANEHLVSSDRRDLVGSFAWHDRREVQRVEAIVDANMIPSVARYSSPLGPRDAVRVMGMFAGALISLLMLVIAPVLVGIHLAQEVHENTLMPLTGTSLSPRQLAIGLAAGPLAIAAILSAPQVAVLLAAAATAGYLMPALGLLAVSCAGGLMLCAFAQLYAIAVGRRRAPGLAAVGLLCVLGLALALGMGVGIHLNEETSGMVAALPQVGAFHLWREAFVPAGRLGIHEAFVTDVALILGTVGFLALCAITWLAVERRIAGRFGPSLRRIEALIAAGVAVVMAMFVIPEDLRHDHGEGFFLLTLAMLTLPFAALIMARTPVGDVPPALRRIPLSRLAGEFGVFLALHAGVSLLVIGDLSDLASMLNPVTLFYLAWSLGVLLLMAVRTVALPLKIASSTWVGLCSIWVILAYVQACVWTADHMTIAGDVDEILAMAKLSPLLGVVQLALIVWVPWSLARALRRSSAGID